MTSNIKVLNNDCRDVGAFLRRLAVRADLGEFVDCAVVFTTKTGGAITGWQMDPLNTLSVVGAVSVLQQEMTNTMLQKIG